jgi:hypothetical protein
MARRSRRNPLSDYSDGELAVGALVAVVVVGGIVYFATRSSAATAAVPAANGGLTATQLGVPSGTPASYLSGDTGVTSVPGDASGNPLPLGS